MPAHCLLVLAGCDLGPVVEKTTSAVIDGADDRRQVYELDAALRDRVAGASVALFYNHHLLVSSSPEATLRAQSATEALGLCAGERFADEPAGARCSGVLIDDDLVATAAHCLKGDTPDLCRQTRVAFGYWYEAPGAPPRLRDEDVFSCARVVVDQSDQSDFVVMQLDRPATPRHAPIELGRTGVRLGDRLNVASHGAGLPLKVETSALVTSTGDDGPTFVAGTDTFGGSSGGPLLDAELRWVGLVSSGALDWEWSGECARARRAEGGIEQHQRSAHVVRALCASGWPSARLCGVPAACGDGICSGAETASGCAVDCTPPRCGDGRCDGAEHGVCALDCNRDDQVPLAWPFSPDGYRLANPDAKHPGAEDSDAAAGCSLTGSADATPAAWLALAVALGARRRRRPNPSVDFPTDLSE